MTRLYLVTEPPKHPHPHHKKKIHKVATHFKHHRIWYAFGIGCTCFVASFIVTRYGIHLIKVAEISLAAVVEAIINRE